MPAKIYPRRPRKVYLAEHREARHLTQKQLAERLGCDVMTISRWELGKTAISTDALAAIAEALWGDLGEPEDLYHHPDKPSADQLLRQLPDDDKKHFMKQIRNAAKLAS